MNIPPQHVPLIDDLTAPEGALISKFWYSALTTLREAANASSPALNPSGITVSGFINPISAVITLEVSAPLPLNAKGSHLYLEIPDQSATSAATVGTAVVGSSATGGSWAPIDLGIQPGSAQPWTLTLPAPAAIDPTLDTPCRLYASSYTGDIDNPLVRAGLTGETPSQTFTLVSLASGSPTAGTNVTTLTGGNGSNIGITAAVLSPVNVTGKLETPVLVLLTDAPPNTPGWVAQLVLTIGIANPTDPANQQVIPGFITQAGPVYAPAADGISVPHSFALDTPTAFTAATIWLQAGLVDANGNYQWNNIVPGITPSWPISYGSTTGTTDASSVMQATIAATMSVVAGLFGVAAAGITNPYLGSGAVATLNLQNLAVTNPILALLAVDSAQLANSAATSTKIANLAVGTAAIQLLAVDTTIVANLAVSTAKIQSLAVTTTQIAFATIANANLGSAIVAQANIANLAVGTAQIQALAVTGAKIDNLTVTAANIANATITSAQIASLDVTKLNAGTISVALTLSAAAITGGSISISTGSGVVSVSSGTTGVSIVSGIYSSFIGYNLLNLVDVSGLTQIDTTSISVGGPFSPAVLSTSQLKVPSLPSSSPGAGTKQLWYDPADGNRVKFAA